ncbi:hypothetical protein MMC24_001695 [Lignoscripta atroalba]|nr:hypothetical protein [Lignoscripta atroalba]
MAPETPNPLLSTHKSSDSGLRILLHPLVLLTISDYITRHTLRRREGPIIGALLGLHNGREISLEHAFEAEAIQGEGGSVLLHESWFKDRLQQYKDVHKDPALELVGWFTTAPVSGPQLQHIPIHQQIMHTYNESAVLLAFHPTTVLDGATIGGKLPLTIYESVYESEKSVEQNGGDGDRSMQVDGQDSALDFKFRELPYSVETGEAEMISVDFVARGGGNATAVNSTTKAGGTSQASQTPIAEPKGKEKSSPKEVNGVDDSSLLSAEDEELIASLTTRANAIKMLHSRIQLLKSYLSHLPPCYLTTPPSQTPLPTSPTHQPPTEIHHPLLRSIQALINRLPLLMPADQSSFERESLAEKSDVSLVTLLGSLSNNVKDARELGRKFGIVEHSRQSLNKRGGSQQQQGMVGGEDFYQGSGGEKSGTQGLTGDGYLM